MKNSFKLIHFMRYASALALMPSFQFVSPPLLLMLLLIDDSPNAGRKVEEPVPVASDLTSTMLFCPHRPTLGVKKVPKPCQAKLAKARRRMHSETT